MLRTIFPAAAGLLAALTAQADWNVQAPREMGELAGGASVWQVDVKSADESVRVTGVGFSAGRYQCQVIDNPPGQRVSLAAAAARIGAVAGVNGGYFHQDERPLGLVVSGGVVLHDFERAKLLSGLVAQRNGKWDLFRASSFRSAEGIEAALQAGPWLVEGGKPVAGLNAERRARRTIVGHDGRGNWVFLATGPVTLARVAELLAEANLPGGIRVREALNLDGGSSTALWAATSPQPIQIPSFGEVRNYLAIVPRRK